MSEVSNIIELSQEVIKLHLEDILATSVFKKSARNSEFLSYVVTNKLEGHDENLTGYNIGRVVFDRDEDFDPTINPIVRTQAVRLRAALKEYYNTDGINSAFQIILPKGSYIPKFVTKDQLNTLDKTSSHDAAEDVSPTIAVLPFMDYNSDSENKYFAEGIAEEISISLTHFEGIQVIARESSSQLSSTSGDPKTLGKMLGAHFVLTGTVRRSKNRLRISANLIDCIGGAILWADRYDKDLTVDDIFDIQDDITARVVAVVADQYGVIPRHLSNTASRRRTSDISVYEAILRFYNYVKVGSPEMHRETKALLELAVVRDPNYSPAWAYLSEMETDAYVLGFHDDSSVLKKALTYATNALTINKNFQYGHWAKTYALFFLREKEDFLVEARKTMALNPNAAFINGFVGFVLALAGEWDEGIAIIERSIKLNPFYPGWLHLAPCLNHFNNERYDKAYEEALRFRTPLIPWDAIIRTITSKLAGKAEESAEALEELLHLRPDFKDQDEIRHYMRPFIWEDALLEKLVGAISSE